MNYQAQAIAQTQQRASTVSYFNGGVLQRQCACGQHAGGGECEECRKKREGIIQRAAVSAAPVNAVPPIVHDVLSSSGQSLDAETRAFMEPRFGHDFSQVRVHTDAKAAESARAVYALAYTVGRDMVFGKGQYAPGTSEGKRLLAHELTHVVQQSSASPQFQCALELNTPEDAFEKEADSMADILTKASPATERSTIGDLRPPITPAYAIMKKSTQSVQRAVDTLCYATSYFLNPVAAQTFGLIAEKYIQIDYCTLMGCNPNDVYFDNPFAGPIDPYYPAFIVRKNPGTLSSWQIVALSVLSVNRPDILTHNAVRQDYYEIKPDSIPGLAAGYAKLLSINGYMTLLALPYVAGTAYTPSPKIPIASTSVKGMPIEIHLGVRREANGLVVYKICFTTDFEQIAEWVLGALLVLLLILFARGALKGGGPITMPEPVLATTLGEGTDIGPKSTSKSIPAASEAS